MRTVLVGFALFSLVALTACASFQEDMQKADAECTSVGLSATDQAICLNRKETPVWYEDSPGTAPAYLEFAHQRVELALDYDAGKITQAQYLRGLEFAKQTLAEAQMKAVAAEKAQEAAQLNAALQSFGNGLAAGAAAYAQSKANAAAAQRANSINCTTRMIGNSAYTDCN